MTRLATALPRATTDLDRARADMDEFGCCLVEGALSTHEATSLRERIVELADEQARAGGNMAARGSRSRNVMQLLHYGQQFIDLAFHPLSLSLMDYVLGPATPELVRKGDHPEYLLSSISALIVGPGDEKGIEHNDMAYIPQPTSVPYVGNVMWMLSDFSAENGATLVLPGSHLLPSPPTPEQLDAVVPAVGRAGTAFCFEGRTWHRSGHNRTDEERVGVSAYYCAPWLRQKENHVAALGVDACLAQPERVRQMLGYEMFHSLGSITPPGTSVAVNQKNWF